VLVEADWAGSGGVFLTVVSYLLLLAFAALNLRLAGIGVVMVGMFMNLVPIAIDSGMPVRAQALASADITSSVDTAAAVNLRGERHLEAADDHLTFLGDIIPIRPFRQVVSFGDLVLGAGTMALIVNLLKPPREQPWRAH
jgi:hypothetical protein